MLYISEWNKPLRNTKNVCSDYVVWRNAAPRLCQKTLILLMPVSMHFRESGNGRPMIILHGLFGSSDNWLTISRRLESDFRIFLPDLRNHGQSPHTQSHSYEDMTADLELFFENHHPGKAILLGHSMGGKLAMKFAAEHPERIEHLIVADIAPKSYSAEDNEEDQELLLNLMDNLDLSSFTSRKEIDESLSKEIKNISLRQFLIKNIHRNKEGNFSWKINVPVLKKYLPLIMRDVRADFFAGYKPLNKYHVTFIRGLKSNYIRDEDISGIKSIYPQSQIIDIPGAGHWLHSEKPDEFVRAVLSAVQKTD